MITKKLQGLPEAFLLHFINDIPKIRTVDVGKNALVSYFRGGNIYCILFYNRARD
jgi:hypothetical protein